MLSFLSFYVDESIPFGESSRFACTGAPVLKGLGPSCFQLHRLISVLPAREQPQPGRLPGSQTARRPDRQPGRQEAGSQAAVQPDRQPGRQPGGSRAAKPASQAGSQAARQPGRQPGDQAGCSRAGCSQAARQAARQAGSQAARQPEPGRVP